MVKYALLVIKLARLAQPLQHVLIAITITIWKLASAMLARKGARRVLQHKCAHLVKKILKSHLALVLPVQARKFTSMKNA